MPRWVAIAKLEECTSGQAMEVVVEGHLVALFNVEGRYFALDGVCPHQGGPLGCGQLHGQVVTCPWHGWQFDVTTGQSQLTNQIVQPRFHCKVDGDHVFIDLESLEPS